MQFFDFHCDTLMLGYIKKQKNIKIFPEAMLDIERMKKANALGQFFAIFMLPDDMKKDIQTDSLIDDNEYVSTCLNIFKNTMESCSEIIAPAYKAKDIEKNKKAGKMSGLLTFEDGKMIDGKFENLKKYFNQGIRLITLTWNYENCFGAPNSKDPKIMNKGLTNFGKEALSYMNDLGIIIDVSHLSDGGFWDVAELSKKPFLASHSNARSITPHPRNLTSEMIKKISEKGGVIGLNFSPGFLDPNLEDPKSTIEFMVLHTLELIDKGGIESVALGSDFDGIGGNIEIDSVDKVPKFFDALHKVGISDDYLEKIAYKNAMRFLDDTLN